ncbi:Mfa1 family fimbria major subunit [Bacteroides sp. 519]|uniref:Mfa1 family fimbria major subunit n=1 Tax=Bacteroides sp. 519 TaxID=2302937 RepID=UPI0013D763D7|nr:Mfa1 family fimbria major subunit [Bacteroides sp. 519]
MKMNFKYAMMAFAALSMGMASCSDNEGNDVVELEGEGTYVQFGLQQENSTRALYPEIKAEDAETTINSAAVFMLNSNKVITEVFTFEPYEADGTTPKQNIFKATAGTYYFIAAANVPSSVTFALTTLKGKHLDNLNQVITEINEGRFAEFVDLTSTNAAGKKGNFFMTSGVEMLANQDYKQMEYTTKELDVHTYDEIVADGLLANPKKNYVEIKIGRAVAKVETAIGLQDDGTLLHVDAAGVVKPESIEYVVTNNPNAMHFFPNFGGKELFQAPYHTAYPVGGTQPAAYWPNLHDVDNLTYRLPFTKKGGSKIEAKGGVYSYAMENTNAEPTYGNATIVSIKAEFNPDMVVESGATTETANTQAVGTYDFYRIRKNKERTDYYDGRFFLDANDAKDVAETELGLVEGEYEIEEYLKCVCYYIIPLYDKEKEITERYDVVRNHYYELTIDKVLACGYSAPGGDIDTEEPDPLDPKKDTYLHVNLVVKDWTLVKQESGLEPR